MSHLPLILIIFLKSFKFITLIIILTVSYWVGSNKEKKHYQSIRERETQYIHLPAVTSNLETVLGDESLEKIDYSTLATGSVVLASDSFRTFLSQMISILGGNLTPYQSMMDRARREAILRMKADSLDADIIVNVRIQSHSIGSSHHEGRRHKSRGKAIEVLAYGTALKFKKAI